MHIGQEQCSYKNKVDLLHSGSELLFYATEAKMGASLLQMVVDDYTNLVER